MSDVQSFASSIPGFYRKSQVDQLLILAWYAETKLDKAVFGGGIMRQCFKDAGVGAPDMSVYLPRLASKKPPQLLKSGNGYKLAGSVRREFDGKFGGDPVVATISKTLGDLPAQVPSMEERAFLDEALKCYRIGAYRAAIVMTWNVTYAHVMDWILSEHARLAKFNDAIPVKYPKKAGVSVASLDDFDGLKESEVIEILRTAKLIDKNTCQILKDKLTRRNMAAHPSRVVIDQHAASDMVSDLVTNVIKRMVIR